MKIRSFLLFAVLSAMAPLTWAQSAANDLKQQMTAAEFKAAGLDKLSPSELASLDAWLQRKLGVETAVAAEQAREEVALAVEQAREEGRKEVVEKNRGFFDFGSSEPIVSTIVGEFRGFGPKGKSYTLENGQVWEQTEAASLAGVRKTDPKVTIKPGVLGAWYMKIDGYNTQAKVRRVK